MEQKQTNIPALMLNIIDLEYNQVEGQINDVITQREIDILNRRFRNIRRNLQALTGAIITIIRHLNNED